MTAVSQLYKGFDPVHKAALGETYQFVQKHLRHMKRRSGEDYAQHGLEVALTLREASDDVLLLQVALLHDLLVTEAGEKLLQRSPLAPAERKLVQRMHGLRRLHIDYSTEDLDTVLSAFLSEERLLPLRMAHRVNDVRCLERFPKELQKQIATETLHMYTAIAGRLGMNAWRVDMEQICFRRLHPKIAKNIQSLYLQHREVDAMSLRQTQRFLQRELKKEGIACQLAERVKSTYSTYRKMVLKRRTFDELTDRLAMRVVVPTDMDCYRALAVVHARMHPIPGKLKDYIGAPKENGYKSIHTVVYPLPGVTEQPIEIQIRTEHMHHLCEYGSWAHGDYKNVQYSLNAKPARVNLFRNLESLRHEARQPKQFETALRQYFRSDHLAVFDSDNNLYHLPKPATALDFIFHAFPNRSTKLKFAKINGRRQPLHTLLHDGDIVEPLFGRSRRILTAWDKACRHNITRQRIRHLSGQKSR